MEASDRDQLIRHARALSGLCPAPPPFVYFVVNPPRHMCYLERQSAAAREFWYNTEQLDVAGAIYREI